MAKYKRVLISWTETCNHSAYVDVPLQSDDESNAEILKRLEESGEWYDLVSRYNDTCDEVEHRQILSLDNKA